LILCTAFHHLKRGGDLEVNVRAKVTDQGVLIPKQWFEGIDEVEIHRERDLILIEPVTAEDSILSLGTRPIIGDVDDASLHHDRYLTQQ
jgi:virulence-associated protein VagC